MRMFVAIDLDAAARAAVAREQQMAWRIAARAPIKFVNPEQAHLTLVFLGEVQPPQTDLVTAAMRAPIEGVAPFRMAFGGLGVFPPRGAPRVLWLALAEGAREVIDVQKIVAERLQAAGCTLEDREFRPHLTIGRWRQARPSDRPALSAGSWTASKGAMTVDRVTLFESRLSSEGPTHIALAHAPLASP